jgi:energy-converting hydrogenase Eha subunit B
LPDSCCWPQASAGLALGRSGGNFAVDVLPASLVAALGMSLVYIPTLLAALAGARSEQ